MSDAHRNIGELTTLELFGLLQQIIEELYLRMMQTADDGK